MTRTTEEALRRGFDNVVANWPLLLIRLAESVVFTIVAMAAFAGIALGVAAWIGLGGVDEYQTPDGMLALAEMILQHWPILLVALVAFLLLLVVLVVIHSFVEAGIVRVYIDAERAAGPAISGSRWRYRVFSSDRWVEGSKRGWRTLFGIYNVVWGLWALLLLIPFLPVAIAALLMIRQEELGAAAGVGCIGAALLVFVMIPITIAATLWSRKAIVIAFTRNVGTREALRQASREIRIEFARHFLVALVIFGVGIAVGGFLAGFGVAGTFVKSPAFVLMLLPLRILSSLLNTALSGATAGWLTASYAALTSESKP